MLRVSSRTISTIKFQQSVFANIVRGVGFNQETKRSISTKNAVLFRDYNGRNRDWRGTYRRDKELEKERFERSRRESMSRDQTKEQYYDENLYDRVPVLNSQSPAAEILSQGILGITRNVEFLNIIAGFEQSNKYALLDERGFTMGYMLEDESFMSVIMRQVFRLHRPFTVRILDSRGEPVLIVSRKFSIINSRISVFDMNGNKIGETHQEWHPFRRRYNLFVNNIQFGRVDAPFLSWSFRVVNEEQELLASIDRGFIGFGMELLTDAGQYSLRMDPGILQRDMENGAISSGFLRNQVGLDRIYPRVLTYDERAVLLACAISVDFDYFSRHSSHTPYH